MRLDSGGGGVGMEAGDKGQRSDHREFHTEYYLVHNSYSQVLPKDTKIVMIRFVFHNAHCGNNGESCS